MNKISDIAITNDIMKITKYTPDIDILKELGGRLATIRKAQGYSQTELANEAGIGVATLRRIESGRDSQLETWLRLLKALDMAPAIDTLIPETFNSPRVEVLAGQRRKRTKSSPSSGIVWGDET